MTENGYRDEASALYIRTIDQGPKGSLLWIYYKITKYLTEDNWECAFSICKEEMKKSPNNQVLSMMLSNLFVADGQMTKLWTHRSIPLSPITNFT